MHLRNGAWPGGVQFRLVPILRDTDYGIISTTTDLARKDNLPHFQAELRCDLTRWPVRRYDR